MKYRKPLVAGMAAMCLGAALFIGTAPASFASGSTSASSAQTGIRAAYQRGKRLYKFKVACDGCSMDGKSLNKNAAMMLVENGVEAQLSAEERMDLNVYLKRRFRL